MPPVCQALSPVKWLDSSREAPYIKFSLSRRRYTLPGIYLIKRSEAYTAIRYDLEVGCKIVIKSTIT